jgi:hypothetical protein
LGSGVLSAQDLPRGSGEGSTTEASRQEPNAPAERPGEAVSGRDPGNDRDRGRDETDPFDYEASEQISEDLSVSFPVDI